MPPSVHPSIPALPLVITEHGDVTILATIRSTEPYLDPIDIEHNEYVGVDALGRKLHFATTHQRVTIALADDPALYHTELTDLVRAFLGAVRHPAAANLALTLPELLQQCAPYFQT